MSGLSEFIRDRERGTKSNAQNEHYQNDGTKLVRNGPTERRAIKNSHHAKGYLQKHHSKHQIDPKPSAAMRAFAAAQPKENSCNSKDISDNPMVELNQTSILEEITPARRKLKDARRQKTSRHKRPITVCPSGIDARNQRTQQDLDGG
jgi:hypothetical protein